MDKKYSLIGAPDELVRLLQQEFDMDENLASFYVTLLLSDESGTSIPEECDNLALWYMNNTEQELFTTPVFHSRFNISFTETKKHVAQTLFSQFASILSGGDKAAVRLIFSCLRAIYRSGAYIEDHQCCVYYQALQWKTTHGIQEYFTVEDIFPSGNEGYCLHLAELQDGQWKCSHCHDEKCGISKEKFSELLSQLEKKHVFTKYNNMYRFEI